MLVSIVEEEYCRLIAGLLNRDPQAKERERRVREANRELYKILVAHDATVAKADLALARVGIKERVK